MNLFLGSYLVPFLAPRESGCGLLSAAAMSGLRQVLCAQQRASGDDSLAALFGGTESQGGLSGFFGDSDGAVAGAGSANFSLRRIPERQSEQRGTYARAASAAAPAPAQRLRHDEYAWLHKQQMSEARTGVPCDETCPFGRKCGRHFTPATLENAHERVYGPGVYCDEKGTIFVPRTEKQVQKQWRVLMLSWVHHAADDPDGNCTESFKVEGIGPVCSRFARAVYFGLSFGTTKDGFHHTAAWNRYLAAARAGTLQADVDSTAVLGVAQCRTVGDDQLQFETVQWWVMWLRLEDQQPNEPKIVYRNVEMQDVYKLEYVPDMRWWGTTGKVLSRERWITLQKVALKDLSIEFYGQVSDADECDVRLSMAQVRVRRAGGGFGEPIVTLTATRRAHHSNFGSCAKCDADKARWLQWRRSRNRATIGDGQEMKRVLTRHVLEMKEERRIAMEFHQKCAGSSRLSFQYDDKCGSAFAHCPTWRRFRGDLATKWQYRFAIMANLFAGGLLRFSLVPKCLQTGVNFGLSSYFSACVRAAELGILGEETYRQTDSGPDCDAKESHAFHIEFVSRGAVNKLSWIRLFPKHSHNYADRANSMLKEIIWPRGDGAGGFTAPWNLEQAPCSIGAFYCLCSYSKLCDCFGRSSSMRQNHRRG